MTFNVLWMDKQTSCHLTCCGWINRHTMTFNVLWMDKQTRHDI